MFRSTAVAFAKKLAKDGTPKVKRAPSPALMAEYNVSPALASIVGKSQISRPHAVKAVWAHIKENELQNPANKKEIICDDAMKAAFSVDSMGMMQLAKHMNPHFLGKA
jgi:upstream activation factor subunit UAF30